MVCEQLHLLLESGRVKCSRKRISVHIDGVGAVSFGVVHIGYEASLGQTWAPD